MNYVGGEISLHLGACNLSYTPLRTITLTRGLILPQTLHFFLPILSHTIRRKLVNALISLD